MMNILPLQSLVRTSPSHTNNIGAKLQTVLQELVKSVVLVRQNLYKIDIKHVHQQ